MSLVGTWPRVRECLVGIAPAFYDGQRDFPEIMGTGFLVSPLGLVCTCRHVAEAIDGFLRPPGFEGLPAAAVVCLQDEESGRWGFGQIRILSFGHGTVAGDVSAYAGPQPPDISYLLLDVTDTPHLAVTEGAVLEGEPVGIGGLPMGTDLLKAPGWLHQITPTVMTGVVSAILPHNRHRTPHGVLIHAQTLGGSSGSPVFRPDGSVVGMVYAGVTQTAAQIHIPGNERPATIRQPTSLTLCVSSHIIAGTLKGAEANAANHPGRQTWAERVRTYERRERRLGDAVLDRWPGPKNEQGGGTPPE